jgi:hypothetical protein
LVSYEIDGTNHFLSQKKALTLELFSIGFHNTLRCFSTPLFFFGGGGEVPFHIDGMGIKPLSAMVPRNSNILDTTGRYIYAPILYKHYCKSFILK